METIDKELAELEQRINAENAKVKETVVQPEPEPSAPEVKQPVEPVQPEPIAEPVAPNPEAEFDAKQWVEKKGWKSAEDAAKSLRALEQEMHRKNQELSQLKAQQPQFTPSPVYYAPPPQAYAPPANPYNPYQQAGPTEEQVAASYGLPVDDFRKVVAIQRDFYESQARRQQAIDAQRWAQVEAEAAKSADLSSVVSDPAFHNPDVQKEMHEYLSKNPTVMKNPRYLSEALNASLANLGRKNATRATSNTPTLPTEPPKAVGSSASSFSGRKNGGLTMDEAKKLNPDQLEKHLKSIGALKTYEDLAG